jgi:hypothetical protein
MSEPIASPTTGDVPPAEEGEMLQFDQAEFATPAADRPTCSVCHQPILEEYYEINQRVMCPQCRLGVEASIRGGSRMARFLKATILGLLAAAVGAVIYFAFVRVSGANWALIAILVGLMVGGAVRKGTGNRGGRLYQLLAVFLTYSSIVAMNVPLLIEDFLKRSDEKPAARAAAEKEDRGPGGAKAQSLPAGAGAKNAAPAEVAGRKADAARDRADPPPLSALLYVLVMLIGFFYAIPVLEATQAPISGLIYAFALWEAWKINKPVQLVFNGPFRLGAAGVGSEGVADES